MANLFVAIVFPLFKPFLILFLKVGFKLLAFIRNFVGGGDVIGSTIGIVAGLAAAIALGFGPAGIITLAILGAIAGAGLGRELELDTNAQIFIDKLDAATEDDIGAISKGFKIVRTKIVSFFKIIGDSFDSLKKNISGAFTPFIANFRDAFRDGMIQFVNAIRSLLNAAIRIINRVPGVNIGRIKLQPRPGESFQEKVIGFAQGGISTAQSRIPTNINVTINGGMIDEKTVGDISQIMQRNLSLGGNFN